MVTLLDNKKKTFAVGGGVALVLFVLVALFF